MISHAFNPFAEGYLHYGIVLNGSWRDALDSEVADYVSEHALARMFPFHPPELHPAMSIFICRLFNPHTCSDPLRWSHRWYLWIASHSLSLPRLHHNSDSYSSNSLYSRLLSRQYYLTTMEVMMKITVVPHSSWTSDDSRQDKVDIQWFCSSTLILKFSLPGKRFCILLRNTAEWLLCICGSYHFLLSKKVNFF